MTHHVFEVPSVTEKNELIRKLASGKGRRILFMRTKHHAKKLAKALTDAGIPAVDLHGNLSQPARDRNLAAFADGSVRVLVATDVAARGVHVDDIELVIHVDPPMEHKAYLHRSGRTARAGKEGEVVTLVLPEQRRDTAALLRKAAITVTPQQVTAAHPAVDALVGDVAAYVTPAPRAAEPARGQGGGGGRSQGGRSRGEGSGNSHGGGSQGANAQRKRANRDGVAPRTDRSGRPAAAASGSGSGRPAAARGEQRSAYNSSSTSGSTEAPRTRSTGSRRAGAASGAPKLMVGSVVRQNGGGQRNGR
jgi:superfamily II DNA/RNA helicase